MKKDIGAIIAKNRKDKKISQKELSARLETFDIYVKNAAISSWEKGINTPTAPQLLAVCEILGIHNIYQEFIEDIEIEGSENLNDLGKNKLNEYLRLLLSSDEYRKNLNYVL